MIKVILVEPKFSGNIGAVARVMKNFGFSDLVLVNPNCDPLAREAIDRASHGFDVLESSERLEKIPKLDILVATTGKLGTDFNLKRSPISPKELAEKVAGLKNKKTSIGIVFGREDIGLKNNEIEMCDFTVTINSSKNYPVLNLSHSVAIILYELYDAIGCKKSKVNNIQPISKKEKDEILKLVFKIIDSMDFSTEYKRQTQKKLWKQVIGKSMLSKREFMALMGFFKKIS